ncbi:hypothetical protein [Demequina sp. NBRC 110054]|uniref:hypothetical protein n=1 Tax=Demequina sp. NBRC 110054 TaxID=1570343 RepID=UPI0009FF465F|nr:hypothetical protein [Demequina sp. NBRC 110054]
MFSDDLAPWELRPDLESLKPVALFGHGGWIMFHAEKCRSISRRTYTTVPVTSRTVEAMYEMGLAAGDARTVAFCGNCLVRRR